MHVMKYLCKVLLTHVFHLKLCWLSDPVAQPQNPKIRLCLCLSPTWHYKRNRSLRRQKDRFRFFTCCLVVKQLMFKPQCRGYVSRTDQDTCKEGNMTASKSPFSDTCTHRILFPAVASSSHLSRSDNFSCFCVSISNFDMTKSIFLGTCW